MPGPGIHYLVGKDLYGYFASRSQATHKYIAGELEKYPTFLNAGTLGPDFLFFNVKDWPLGVSGIGEAYRDVSDFIYRLRKDLEPITSTIEQIEQRVEAAANDSVILSQITGMINDISTLIDGLTAVITEKVKEYVTGAIDIFSQLQHPIQYGTPLKEWWWFDTLHYRKTGEFAQFLLKNTTKGEPLHAYAMGYLSHVAADVVGHPFVNMIAGGPYRIQPQRHKVIENFNDVHAMNKYLGIDFSNCQIANEFAFDPNGYQPASMPDNLCNLICQAINGVYQGGIGKKITENDVWMAYDLWFKWFSSATQGGGLPAPKPYSLTGELQNAWNTFVNNVENVGDMVADAWNNANGGLAGFLEALAAAILGGFMLAGAILDYIVGTGLTIGVAPFRFFLNRAYEELYNAYWKFRQGVAFNGLAFPSIRHINHNWINHVYDPRTPDMQSHINVAGGAFPIYSAPSSAIAGMGGMTHLLYPTGIKEEELTTPCTDLYYQYAYDYYFKGEVPFENIFGLINNADETNVQQLHNAIKNSPMGNAPRLTYELLSYYENGHTIPNFSLDGDRGMGYPAWRVSGTPNTQEHPIDPNQPPVPLDII